MYPFVPRNRQSSERERTIEMCHINPGGGVMSLADARGFVARMKEDVEFRGKVLGTVNPEEFTTLMRAEGITFDQRELAGAMAECMQAMERPMES
jgi:predicted ribosomally synthesized peptide with nif11-like leader